VKCAREEKTPLTENPVSLQGFPFFVGRGEYAHRGRMGELGQHFVAQAEMLADPAFLRSVADSFVRSVEGRDAVQQPRALGEVLLGGRKGVEPIGRLRGRGAPIL
jgi:hypothetical protein